jgi:hypothetical protein
MEKVFGTAVLVASLAAASASGAAAPTTFAAAVEATHPLAFYRLDGPAGSSLVGTSTYRSVGGVTRAAGPAVGESGDGALALDGTDGYIDTTLHGRIGSAGSLMAWVNLRLLPAKSPHILYVAGESQHANDFDVQFESDNKLHFYTAAGSNVAYAPDPGSLVGAWHMIVVTAELAPSGTRAIYWDGKLVAHDTGGGEPGKTSEFSLGESKVFTGRFFSGAIDEVALWDRALSAAAVNSLYAVTTATTR